MTYYDALGEAAEYEREARAREDEHYAQQGLDQAIGVFGIPEVLRRIAAAMTTPARPAAQTDEEPF